MAVNYGYDTVSPSEDVDIAPEFAADSHHHAASHPLASHIAAVHVAASSRAGEQWWMYAIAAIFVSIIAIIARSFCRPSRVKEGKARPRAALPAFDVEGGTSAVAAGGSSNVLHPSIAQAAKAADTSTLRDWLADERCVVDAALAADGKTALHTAADSGHANVVRLLLDGGADALVVDAESRTPLHLVALAGHGLCVKALLDAGADPEGKDGAGQTPLALAEGQRHMGTARMMRLHLERRTAEGSSLRRAR